MLHRSRTQMLFALLAGLLALALFGPYSATAGAAGTCRVPGQYATIQAAVDDPVCSDIEVEAGTYYENVVISRDVNIQGSPKGETIVDGGNLSHVFWIEGPVTVALSRLIIQNGYTVAEPYSDGGSGGGIANKDAVVTINKSIIRNNTAEVTGGGIWSGTGNLTVSNSTFVDNRADWGAGIGAGGQVTVRASVFSNNSAVVSGGGITLAGGGTGEIAHSVIRNNRATSGAGVVNAGDNTSLLIFKSQITHNTAEEWGGGIANAFSATLTLKQSEVVENTAGILGNDLFNVLDGTTIILRSTVGDIYNEDGTIVE